MTARYVRAALLGVLLVGCTDGTKLSLSSQGDGAGADTEAQTLDLGNGIVLEEVWMAVRRIELSGGDLCPPECALRYGPFPVVVSGADLVSGVLAWEFDVTVPPGTYDRLEVQVNTIPGGKAGGDPVLEALAEAHASVIVKGTVDGVPFTFATPVAFTQEREPFEVPEEGTNLTLEFDPSLWFVDAAGMRLDPLDPYARTEITANIRASLRLFGDHDEDGSDDAGDDGCDGEMASP
ncbi:MAG TPA: hypothetical protein VLS93_00520 [Anaeromyxobacteraceae bacterium]|nr:hypothetical protein [Anaeromyxobacteraceae bacterium]